MDDLIKIILKQYCIEDISMKSPIPDKKIENISNEVELSTNVEISASADNEKEFKVTLTINLLFPEQKQLNISSKITGIFEYIKSEENDRDKLSQSTAPGVLYGILREKIFYLTSQSPYPPLMLPIFEFPEKVCNK